jgi:cytosine/adenosine deaminase-related metal-dependent hydrolase
MPSTIDQPVDIRFALEGRVVTMDAARTVLDNGVVYVNSGNIVAVLPEDVPAPAGFDDVPITRSRGTIFPGLIELHNPLPYDVLPLWNVPQLFASREQWRNHREKRALVSAPMRVLGETAGLIEAVVRYVECKCLVAGVTGSQGITLFSAPGSQRFYRGIVRNVEKTDDPELPHANTKVSDVEAEDVSKFFDRLQSASCLLLHLSEGIDDRARSHFHNLQLPQDQWAITRSLAGIHSLGLTPEDLAVYGEHKGAIVWSPLSNLLLYGDTLNLASVVEQGIRLGLGSDWSPTGSKNLLAELKVARIVNTNQGNVLTDTDLVALATSNAADILQWGNRLGSLEPGKYADLIVISGRRGDPYAHLLDASETRLSLVVVHGAPRCGWPSLMEQFAVGTESVHVGRSRRVLNLHQETADPVVAGITLQEATDRLNDGLSRLHELATQREVRLAAVATGRTVAAEPEWKLLLEQDEPVEIASAFNRAGLGICLSTPGGRERSEPLTARAVTEATATARIVLDKLTVADDPHYIQRLSVARNVPKSIKAAISELQ